MICKYFLLSVAWLFFLICLISFCIDTIFVRAKLYIMMKYDLLFLHKSWGLVNTRGFPDWLFLHNLLNALAEKKTYWPLTCEFVSGCFWDPLIYASVLLLFVNTVLSFYGSFIVILKISILSSLTLFSKSIWLLFLWISIKILE